MSNWTQRLPPFVVYKIVEKLSGRIIYIGLTKRTLKARLQAHSDHTDSSLNKEIKLKGKDAFTISPIDYADNQKDGWIKEEFWTRFFLMRGEPLRNKDYARKRSIETKKKLSDSHKGLTISLKQREKLSLANKGRFMGIDHLRSKCVCCIETSMVYGSISEASRETGACLSAIAHVCKGERQTAGGYRWRYASRKEYELCHRAG